MTIRFTTKKFTINDEIKDWVGKKLKKLDKFFPSGTEAVVTLVSHKNSERVEITIVHNGAIFRAEESDKDYKCALDTAVAVIERQIRKNRTRLGKKIHVPKEYFAAEDFEDAEEEFKISKIKKFDMHPMTAEEAILQMNLLSHSFFLFRNAETGSLNVVYKRRDGSYGFIEPNE